MSKLRRLARMDRAELGWRGRAFARIAADRAAARLRPPRWDRNVLADILVPEARPRRQAASDETHRHLAALLAESRQRFVIAPRNRRELPRRILAAFPGAAAAATARADRILDGEYDLLGYAGLRFTAGLDDGAAPGAMPDWHLDPVHDRRAPKAFWASVPYLHHACGDHKVVWELNRHQHWLTLGRAWWLTGEPKYRARIVAELESWLAANRPLIGINWASMLELAFRSLSWIWAINFLADPDEDVDEPWLVDLLLGLDRQLTHVERNLSYYFSPNTHLLGEALALYVSGRALPLLAAGARREALGRQILLDQSRAQIGADGGHLERSTHYHRYTLDFYILALVVARITDDPAAGAFQAIVAKLADAARALADSHGVMPHLGDDDGGATWAALTGRPLDDISDSLAVAAALTGRPDLAVAVPGEEPIWLLAHPMFAPLLDSRRPAPAATKKAIALPDMGYYIARSDGGDHLVIDGGAHGYGNAGHAHADALALTLTVCGLPLLIDPGTAAYTIDPALRDQMRSTVMHNTVVVDGEGQSVASGPFHWRSVANGAVHRWTPEGDTVIFEGTHDGYGVIEHRRVVVYTPGEALTVTDVISGEGEHEVAAHWHVDPRWTVAIDDAGRISFRCGERRVELRTTPGVAELFHADAPTGLGWHSPVYGRVEPATTVRITTRGPLPVTIVSAFQLANRTFNEEDAKPAEQTDVRDLSGLCV